jgi:hypothetical protein
MGKENFHRVLILQKSFRNPMNQRALSTGSCQSSCDESELPHSKAGHRTRRSNFSHLFSPGSSIQICRRCRRRHLFQPPPSLEFGSRRRRLFFRCWVPSHRRGRRRGGEPLDITVTVASGTAEPHATSCPCSACMILD